MKATVILGSPRGKKSASYHVAQQFVAGLRRAEVEVDEILLKDYTINHCIGCYTCWTKTPGKCVHRDDMDILLPKLRTDLLVIATPLYYYNFPGNVKTFIDRQLPLNEPFLVERGDVTGHPRRDGVPSPDTFLISVAGFPERSHFDALVATVKKFSHCIGQILIGGAEPMSQDALQGVYTDLYKHIEQAGFEVGKEGRMSQETEQAIIAMTTYAPEKIEEFRKMGNAHWKALMSKEPEKRDLKMSTGKELTLSDGGMASFMAGMAMQYNPRAIPGFNGVIQFDLDAERYHFLIHNDQCKAYAGAHPESDMTLIAPKQVWLDVASGKLDGAKALMDGLYKTEGDMSLLMKFDQLFGSDKEEDASRDTSTASEDDRIPEHRGPIVIPAMTWLTVAFLPWMILWIWGSFAAGPLPRYLAAGVSALIAGYHLSTNVVTLFESGTAIYFIISALMTAAGWQFFLTFGRVVDNLFLSGLWFGSVPRRFTLTAEYVRYLLPKPIWQTRAFNETNRILCAAWGGYFLVNALLMLIMIAESGSKAVYMIVSYGLLVPMFIFTGKFQKWYPEKLMRTKSN